MKIVETERIKVGIIGYGHFGKFLFELGRKYFSEIDLKVFSRSQKKDGKVFLNLEEVLKSDIVFIAVPIKNIGETILKIKDLVSKNTIIVDISTVKEYPEKEFRKYSNLKYVCTHPMFGPFSYKKIGEKLDNLRVVLTSHNLSKNEYEILKNILVKKLKLKYIEMTSEKHDRMLSETLFLTHFLTQIIINADYKRTEIDTVSFGFLMDAVESVKDDVDLFRDVYKYNKYAKKVVEKIEKSLENVRVDLLS